MIEWIEVLEILAVVMASIAVAFAFAILVNFARQALRRVKPQLVPIVRQEETKKEIPRMSKEKGEGVTFNDIFMFMIAVPLVLLWVGFAGFVIHSGLNDAAVLEQIEGYTTLIAILGGPALLIIKDALDVWWSNCGRSW